MRSEGELISIVDADVHPAPVSFDEVLHFLPHAAGQRHALGRMVMEANIYLNAGASAGARGDSRPANGGPAGSDPVLLRNQLFDDAGVDLAILVPSIIGGTADPEHESHLRSAINAWLVETWLTQHNADSRFRGSVTVSPRRPDLAAAEIHKWGGHPNVVQVLIDPYLAGPLGGLACDPIYSAAVRYELPIILHVSRTPGMSLLTPVGFPSFYAEIHPLYSMLFIHQLVSLLVGGVFERFPSLRVVLAEGGVSWLAPLLWRLDNHWRQYRKEVPNLRRPPSEYVLEHVRLTSQPLEEPERADRLEQYLEWLEAGRILMFSSDYPHWDFDDPNFVARRLPKDTRARVMSQNAIELYGLPLAI